MMGHVRKERIGNGQFDADVLVSRIRTQTIVGRVKRSISIDDLDGRS